MGKWRQPAQWLNYKEISKGPSTYLHVYIHIFSLNIKEHVKEVDVHGLPWFYGNSTWTMETRTMVT